MPNDSANASITFPLDVVDDDVTFVNFVEVYVRKGADNRERWLSFTLPDTDIFNTPDFQLALLRKGVALDGNQALWSISRVLNTAKAQRLYTENPSDYEYAGVFGNGGFTLPDALAAEQLAVADWLKDQGFQALFR
jgi:hypothetical protein